MDVAKDKHTDILEQNDAILDKFHEDLKDSANEQNKVSINTYKSPSFYLPPIDNVIELLGFPLSQKKWIDFIEASYKSPLKVARTSRYKFFNEGVGLKTVSKIVVWLKKLPIPLEQILNKRLMVKLRRSHKTGSNAGDWLSFLRGFELETPEQLFTTLFDFIEHRCDTEMNLKLAARLKVKSGELKQNDLNAWRLMQSLWANSPSFTQDIIDNFELKLRLDSQKKSLSEPQWLAYLESYCYLYFDFYLEVITHYEIGCRFYFNEDQDKRKTDLGIITKSIFAYATDEEVKTCFGGLLKEFKGVGTELVGETSFRKLASFIEIEEEQSTNLGVTLEEKQHNQFKDWRNGKSLPSNLKLTTFLCNFDKYIDSDSGFITFVMCRISMGIDKLINEFIVHTASDNCAQADIEAAIKKVLANMPDYYQANLKTELEKEKLKEKEPLT